MKLYSVCNKITIVALLQSFAIQLCVYACPYITFSVLVCCPHSPENRSDYLVQLYYNLFEVIKRIDFSGLYVFAYITGAASGIKQGLSLAGKMMKIRFLIMAYITVWTVFGSMVIYVYHLPNDLDWLGECKKLHLPSMGYTSAHISWPPLPVFIETNSVPLLFYNRQYLPLTDAVVEAGAGGEPASLTGLWVDGGSPRTASPHLEEICQCQVERLVPQGRHFMR